MPTVMMRLMEVEDDAEAERLYWRIDSVVVRDGSLRPGADAVASCLVQGLIRATSVARIQIFELLAQLGGGVTPEEFGGQSFSDVVHREVLRGFPFYCEYLESASPVERFHCIDLLSLCAYNDRGLKDRTFALLSRAAELGDRERALVEAIFRDLDDPAGGPTGESGFGDRSRDLNSAE
ncbi:MAG: hypothetical protein ACJ73S_07920 [Mycobacteriales bacterium]